MNVFEVLHTFECWDDDYYQPVALRYYDRAIARMVAELKPAADEVILDAGCGPGVHSIRAALLGHRVQAIDLSHRVIEEARERAGRAGVGDRIQFRQADLTKLPFADGSFGAIFSWGVLTHVPDMGAALDELARVLKPGGRLAIQTTNAGAWDFALERLARTVARRPIALEQRAFGSGCWYEWEGDRLWVWRADIEKISRHLATRGLRRAARLPAELTELHRRVPRWMRPVVLPLNNAWFAARLPAGPACTNIVIYEKNR